MTPRGVNDVDAGFMWEALVEAQRGVGRTHPNPTVGCVIVRDGHIVGRGFHKKAGTAHAEVVALRQAGARAKGATAYVTLEPCGHYGKTPPCSEALVHAGISRVVFASRDPNPLVQGRGLRFLKNHRVVVNGPLLQAEADALNRPFFKFMRTQLPFVTLKVATSLDGQLATAQGDSKWLSSETSRVKVHQLRNRVDAILVGAATARIDDPLLTTRLPRGTGRNPVRVVVDGSLSLSLTSQLVKTAKKVHTIVATTERARSRKANALSRAGVEVWHFKRSGTRVVLTELLARLADRGLLHLLVEGGASVHGQFITQGLADEVIQFIAPRLLGADAKTWSGELGVTQVRGAPRLRVTQVELSGGDVMIVSEPESK